VTGLVLLAVVLAAIAQAALRRREARLGWRPRPAVRRQVVHADRRRSYVDGTGNHRRPRHSGRHGTLFVAAVAAGPDLPTWFRPQPVGRLRSGIELRDVWFGTHDRRPWILRGVDPGSLHWDGMDIRDLDVAHMRRRLSEKYRPAGS
jgi:hypothetical protein